MYKERFPYEPFPEDYELKKELIEYANDIINKKIIGCEKHIWSCQRFLNDLENEGTEEFPYIFDERAALSFLNWMKLFKHSKGILAGQRIDPHIIQKFIFGNIYGWKHKDTGYRRFTKAYWQVGRKNAKSQSLSSVGSYETMAFGELGSEVYCGATKKEQADIVWKETERMLSNCKELEGSFRVAYNTIYHDKSYSEMKSLSKEDRKTGDGLNPQCGIIDEYHAHDTSEIYDVIETGMVARSEPLLMIITTAGFDLNNPCFRIEYDLVSKILNPDYPYKNENYFVMINELDKDDDINNEENWIKPNPILCSYEEGFKSLRRIHSEATEKPEKMRNFLTKNMNIWIQMRDAGYMDLRKWNSCGSTEDNPYPDVNGLKVIAGLDLSSSIDLTSVGFEVELPDGRIAVLSHSFIPEDKMREKIEVDKVPFDLWVEQGWVTATPGSVVDYTFVLDYIEDQYKKHNWAYGEICFDRAMATWLTGQLADRGFTPVETPQGKYTLGEPTKKFRETVYDCQLIHDNNPVLTWAIGNAVVREDYNGNIQLDKQKSKERIDPIAALMNSHTRVVSQFNQEQEDIFYSPEL